MKGSLLVRFYNKDFELTEELPIKDLLPALRESEGIRAIVFDGIITQRLVDLAMQKGIEWMAGIRMGNVKKKGDIKYVTL